MGAAGAAMAATVVKEFLWREFYLEKRAGRLRNARG
jgi:hypothetical protein